ncbi:NADH dehydrogenase [ubiquinone] 1 beta subcomplex subunit 11, mitochondrial [Eurosta solidaginis]|uniref:NADH dehydrogenase [ubiquinone] 1 beta subcomplex subunit 11, mitochondrial n=1 Tax=Eurosta solidaginis TaxID=178769 RepID=UPI003531321C
MSALFRLANRQIIQRSLALNLSRSIKTSQKKDETAIVTPSTTEDFAKPNPKNWVSYGFEYESKEKDRSVTNWTFFASVTLCLVWGTFIWSYAPDPMMRDWAQREAYLELRRREQAGVDLINPNYVDPDTMNLPSDEELGDTEIII